MPTVKAIGATPKLPSVAVDIVVERPTIMKNVLTATIVPVVDVKVLENVADNGAESIIVLPRTVSNLDSNAMKTQIVTSQRATGVRVEVR